MENILNQVINFLSNALGSSATIAVVLEFVFRMLPTEKPLSTLHVISKSIRLIADVLLKIAELSDKVLPQKLK